MKKTVLLVLLLGAGVVRAQVDLSMRDLMIAPAANPV
jgi:hypothetical protein